MARVGLYARVSTHDQQALPRFAVPPAEPFCLRRPLVLPERHTNAELDELPVASGRFATMGVIPNLQAQCRALSQPYRVQPRQELGDISSDNRILRDWSSWRLYCLGDESVLAMDRVLCAAKEIVPVGSEVACVSALSRRAFEHPQIGTPL